MIMTKSEKCGTGKWGAHVSYLLEPGQAERRVSNWIPMKYLLPWASALHFDVLTCFPCKYLCVLSYSLFVPSLVLLFALTARPTMFDPYVWKPRVEVSAKCSVQEAGLVLSLIANTSLSLSCTITTGTFACSTLHHRIMEASPGRGEGLGMARSH